MTAETKIDLRWSVLWGVVIALSPLSGAARVGVSIVAGLGGSGVAFALLRLRRRRGGGAPLAGPLIRADTLTPAVWALLAASVALFLPTFVWLFGQYTAGIWRNGHGFFVPVAMFWFARSRLREEPGPTRRRPGGSPCSWRERPSPCSMRGSARATSELWACSSRCPVSPSRSSERGALAASPSPSA